MAPQPGTGGNPLTTDQDPTVDDSDLPQLNNNQQNNNNSSSNSDPSSSDYVFDDHHHKPQIPNDMPPPPPMAEDLSWRGTTSPPTHDSDGNAHVMINTEALQDFGKYLHSLADPLNNLKIDVDKVTVHAGAFYQAFHLENAVQGDNSLQRNTSTMITQALDAMALIQRAITKLTAEYDSVEELNSAGADDLTKFVSEAKTVINKMSS